MKGKSKKRLINLFVIATFIGIVTFFLSELSVQASPRIDLSITNAEEAGGYVENIKLLIFLTVLTLLPSIIITLTSFTRIVIVFSFLKSAIGAQQSIPNQVLIGLAIFLTVFIMKPVMKEINEKALQPYEDGIITEEVALRELEKPLKKFMLKETRESDLELFLELTDNTEEVTIETIPFTTVVPAFIVSELKTAFQMGFLIFLPFLIIDMVVGSCLMAMGMFMLPPTMVSIPFKLLLFVMVDGWNLLIKSLVTSFY